MGSIKLPDYTALNSPLPTPEAPTSIVSYNAGGPQEAAAQQGAVVAKEGSDLQDLYAKSNVNDVYANSFSPQVRDLAQQFYALNGKDAVDQLPAFQQKISELRNNTLNGMPIQQQEMFNPLATQRTEMEMYRMTLHADQQAKEYTDTTHKAVLANQVDEASTYYNDPNAYNQALHTGMTEIDAYASKTGKDPAFAQAEKTQFSNYMDTARQSAIKDYVTSLPGPTQLSILRPYMQKMGQAVEGGTQPTDLPKNFDDASNFLISKFEGTDLNPNDGGKGPSKFGVLGSANGLTPDQVASLSPDDAKSIYKKDYWDKIGADQLPDNMKYLAFDTAVNMGVPTAQAMLKQADGDPEKLLQLRQDKYEQLAKDNPAKYGGYMDGWQGRQDTLSAAVGSPLTSPQSAMIQNLPADDIPKLYRGALTQTKMEQNAGQEQLKQQQESTMNNYLTSALQGKLSVGDIEKDQTLNFDQREKVLNMLWTTAQRQDKTDPSVFSDLLGRVHAKEGDPGTITDPDSLIPFVGNGISKSDLVFLRGELAGKNQEGFDLKSKFVEMAKSKISGSNLIQKDPAGDEAFYNWNANFEQQIKDGQKAGKTMNDMLSPQSKDYLGPSIDQFVRSPTQQIQDMSNRIRGAAAAQAPAAAKLPPEMLRQPGESINAYLARTTKK